MTEETPLKNHKLERALVVRRVVICSIAMAVLTGALVARLYYLQILKHEYYSLRSEDNRTTVQVVSPVRGIIYDRHGMVLAGNVPAYRIEVIPNQVDDMEAALDRLDQLLGLRKADRQRFRERMRENPDYLGIPILFNLSKQEVARFVVNQRQFPGMRVEAGLRRHYPLGKAAAHLVGYAGAITAADLRRLDRDLYRGTSHVGKTGVEKAYEKILHGRPGSRVVEVNAAGRPLRQLAYHPPKPGRNIYLTIDAHLQKVAYRALGDRAGAVVAIDPDTGGILALVSRPSYKPGLFVGGITQQQYQALLSNPWNPLFNRALNGAYPPGSTIKPVWALAALATNVIDPDKELWCPAYITLPGSDRHWRGWNRGGFGWVAMQEAIFRSSDVYFYQLGLKLGIDTMHRFGNMFGLGHKTGIDLPGEDSGLMPSRRWKHAMQHQPWFPGETLNTAIGQGYMKATPLQLAFMTALIAGRGNSYKPHVLNAIENPVTGERIAYEPEPVSIPITDPQAWELVIDAMEKVVHSPRGTAYSYIGRDIPYRMAGKSGTAQVVTIAQGQAAPDYEDMPVQHRPHALFIAFAPVADPRIAVAVVVEHGGGGSSTAGPVARKVIDAYLGVPREAGIEP